MDEEKMTYVKFTCGTAFCGCEDETYIAFKGEPTAEFLNQWAHDYGIDNAERYEDIERDYDIDPDCYDTAGEYEEAYDDARDEYYESAWGDWEYTTKEEWEENGGYHG